MNTYKPRTIEFKELITIEDWRVKVYTITKGETFENHEFYDSAIAQLPKWLQMENGFNSSHENIGFLIFHVATEGIFSIINWWVGKNMLNTVVFITDPEQPEAFKKISGDGLGPCVWELEIINHERQSWMKNMLKKEPDPDYNKYLSDTISIEI